MRFHLFSSSRKTPKATPLSAPPAKDDPNKQAEADARASAAAANTLVEVKSFFTANSKATGKVLCMRGKSVDVVNNALPADSAHIPGRHYVTPLVNPKDFSRQLLAAVNHLETKARDCDDSVEHKQRLLLATESVKTLMNYDSTDAAAKSTFTDTPKFRKAVNALCELQRAHA